MKRSSMGGNLLEKTATASGHTKGINQLADGGYNGKKNVKIHV